jgi:hypothetical protein
LTRITIAVPCVIAEPSPHEGARGDESIDRRGPRGKHGADREQQRADDVDPFAPDQIREPAHRNEQCRDREVVADEHPLRRRQVGRELVRDRRQRNDRRRRVEHGDEDARDAHREDEVLVLEARKQHGAVRAMSGGGVRQ